MADFAQAAALVLEQEGPHANDPHDTGGLTTWGISQAAHPSLNVANITRDDAIAIYHDEYWEFDGVANQRLANLLLSLSVNAGKGVAIRLLQRAVGGLRDGVWGPMTEHLANVTPNATMELAAEAVLFYVGLGRQEYLRGWIRRVLECL